MAITDKYGFTEIPVGTSAWATTYDANMVLVENHLHTHLRLTLGETVSQYDVLYLNASGKACKASTATFPRPAIGMAVEDGVAEDVINAQRVGKITNPSWDFRYLGWAVYLSATAGGVTQVEGSDTQVIGIAYDANTILLRFGYAVAVAATTTTTTSSSTTSTTHTTTTTESGTTSSTASTTSTTSTIPFEGCAGSNASFHDEDCADISDWVDGDGGTGVSSQVTFDTRSCFKFDSGTPAGSANYALRTRDVGTFGNHVVFELETYFETIGEHADLDRLSITLDHADTRFVVVFGSDGLLINDGAVWTEVGIDLVQTGVWQTWLFDIDFTTPASATVDVYLGSSLQEAGVDCSYVRVGTSGLVSIRLRGNTTAHRICYFDFLKIGDDCL